MAEVKFSPCGTGTVTTAPLAAEGPLSVTVTLPLIVWPTLGVPLLIEPVSARSAICGVSVALEVVPVGAGSYWSAVTAPDDGLRVGAHHLGGDRQAHGRTRGERPHGPDAGPAVVGPRGGRGGDDGEARGQEPAESHIGRRIGTIIGQGRDIVDRVADVGCRLVETGRQREGGLLGHLGGAGRVVAAGRIELIAGADARYQCLGRGAGDTGVRVKVAVALLASAGTVQAPLV